jgi:hypothetical protein
MAEIARETGGSIPGPIPEDPVPESVRAGARAAFRQFAAAAELAPLVYDSLGSGVTSPERFWLVFQHRTAQLQLRITPSRGGWELHGRLDPPDSLQAELEIDGSDVALVESASRGEFTLRGAPPGVIRVIVTSDPRTVLLQTDWFVLGALPAA